MTKIERRLTHDNNGKYRLFIKGTSNGCYGNWSKKLEKLLADTVRGRDVIDLGSGTGVLSIAMAEYGANTVLAVDDVYNIDDVRGTFLRNMEGYSHKIKLMGSFAELLRVELLLSNKLFVLSWPQVDKEWYMSSQLMRLMEVVQEFGLDLVLIAANSDSVSCGCLEMYSDLGRMHLRKQLFNGDISVTVYKGAKTEEVSRVAGFAEYMRSAISNGKSENEAIRMYDLLMTESNPSVEFPGYKFSSENRG